MDNLYTNPVAAGSAGPSSHTTMLHDNPHEAFYLTRLPCYYCEEYIGGSATDPDGWELGTMGRVFELTQALIFRVVAHGTTSYHNPADAVAAANDPTSDVFYLEPHELELMLGSPPWFSGYGTGGAGAAGIDPRLLAIHTVCPLSPNGEHPFLLNGSFGDDLPTPTSSVKEGESNALEAEGEGEGEGDEDKDEKVGPHNPSHEAEAAASAPTDDLQCPGLASQTEAKRKVELNKLLGIANAGGAEARKSVQRYVKREADAYKCTECGKTGRHDRLVAHAVYKHLGIKTWACPFCPKSYATRDDLSQHLKAIVVACLCGKSISKNNWYAHALACEACLPFAGKLSLHNGRIVGMERQTKFSSCSPS